MDWRKPALQLDLPIDGIRFSLPAYRGSSLGVIETRTRVQKNGAAGTQRDGANEEYPFPGSGSERDKSNKILKNYV